MTTGDEHTITAGDWIVSGDIVAGYVLKVTDRWFEVVAPPGVLARIPRDAPMRRALDRRGASTKLEELAQLPSAERRALLDRDPRLLVELAAAMKCSPRAMRHEVLTGQRPEEPTHLFEHEYLGAFDVSGELLVCDPANVDLDGPPLLVSKTAALAGRWHAYARVFGWQSENDVSLLVLHADFLDDYGDRGRELGTFGVDSGIALVTDVRIREDAGELAKLRDLEAVKEGIVGTHGCLLHLPDGDGVYFARVIERGGHVVGVRMNLTHDRRWDQLDPPPDPGYAAEVASRLADESDGVAVRAYSPSETFAVGDRVRHPKFGEGIVEKVCPEKKVEIAFRDGRRKLQHAAAKS